MSRFAVLRDTSTRENTRLRGRPARAGLTVVLAVLALAIGCNTEAAKHKAAGNMHFNQGEYAEALAAYEKAVAAAPDDAAAHVLRGNALIELGRYDDARAAFDRALEIDPKHPEAHRGAATVISHTAQPGDHDAFDAFLRHAEAIIAERPKDKSAIINAASVLSESANPDDPETYQIAQQRAERYLRDALEIDDRDPKLLFHLTLVYARQGDIELALRVVDRLEKVEPEPGLHLYAAAIAYTIVGDHTQALASAQALLDLRVIDPEELRGATLLRPLHDDPRFIAMIDAARGPAD